MLLTAVATFHIYRAEKPLYIPLLVLYCCSDLNEYRAWKLFCTQFISATLNMVLSSYTREQFLRWNLCVLSRISMYFALSKTRNLFMLIC